MLTSLRKRLIVLYTITTGAILTAVFLIAAFLNEQQNVAARLDTFKDQVYTISTKLQLENSLSDSWLAELETTNKMIIKVYDNGAELFYSGAYSSKTDRNILISKLIEEANKDYISLFSRPISSEIIKSSTYTIKGNSKDTYYGCTVVVAKDHGYRTLILLQLISENSWMTFRQYALYIILDFVGILALFLVSRKLVDHSMKPVRENQRRQVEFIAAASHELRSPLSVIRASNTSLNPKEMESVKTKDIIEQECKRMSRLINDMLLLASSDTNTWSVDMKPLEVDTLLIETYEMFFLAAKEKQISLQLKLPEDPLPLLIGDKERLLQIMSILLDNALHFSIKGKGIELTTGLLKKHLWIHIVDHGIGIEDKDKPYIFERFYCVDKSRKDKAHYGLGLSIAKELITLHQGTIGLQDTPGGGSTFVLSFPILVGV